MSTLREWVDAALTVADTEGMADGQIIPTWPSDATGFYPTLTIGALREWQAAYGVPSASCAGLVRLSREHWQALWLLEFAVRQGRGHESITKALDRLTEVQLQEGILDPTEIAKQPSPGIDCGSGMRLQPVWTNKLNLCEFHGDNYEACAHHSGQVPCSRPAWREFGFEHTEDTSSLIYNALLNIKKTTADELLVDIRERLYAQRENWELDGKHLLLEFLNKLKEPKPPQEGSGDE